MNETIEIIKKGFEFLKQDCGSVFLSGFVDKKEIPEKAKMELYKDEYFDHEYSDLKTNYWDDCDFWGKTYLHLKDEIYMEFEVHA